MKLAGIRTAALVALVLVALVALGCAGPVGPVHRQGGAGLEASNSALNAASMTADSWNAATTGPVSGVQIEPDGADIWKTGQVTRDLAFTDGSNQLTLSSGTDIQAKGLRLPMPNGQVLEIEEFATVSSVPLRAANEAWDRLGDVIRSLGADQAEVEAQRLETQGRVAESLQPVLAQLVRAAAGL